MVSSPSAQRVVEAARHLGLDIQIREFPEGTRTAEDAARAIGVQVGQIVKSLVFIADARPVVCLISGANRLDPSRLEEIIGAKEVRPADANQVRQATGFSIGGVPPFGHDATVPVYCDRDLLAYDVVWAAAGTPMTVFSIEPGRLASVCEAVIGDLKVLPAGKGE